MNVTSPDRVIEQQTADSNAPAENKFSDAAASGARHNDPRQQQGGKQQRQQGGQQKRDRRDVHGWVILDKPIGMDVDARRRRAQAPVQCQARGPCRHP